MNFLAHIYLSGEKKDLMIGNFIADHLGSRQAAELPAGIREGIILHHKIDSFTDRHPVVEQSKIRLRPQFGKYAPVITDLYYDHFLAAEWFRFSNVPLPLFAGNFYESVRQYETILPEKTRHMLRYMIPNNWLVSYSTIEGISKALAGMSRRARFESKMEYAGSELEKNYGLYHTEFTEFFNELQLFVESEKVNSEL